MSDHKITAMTAQDLAAAIRHREISPVEAVRASIDRIDDVNPKLNCFCFVYPDEAIAQAREAERRVMRGDDLGPLHGVPIAIKDMTPTKGKRTTLGSYGFKDWVPDHDAVVVERLTGAGAIMVGKTTTSELAFSFFTNTPLWGVTRNPWDVTRTPGGSSGGSAAAVASGCVPLAEGCDMGGSVRLPASFCGIVGLKPSFGRIPFDILPSQFDSYCHFGPLARTVGDAALFLAAAQGPDDRDFSSLPQGAAVSWTGAKDVGGLKIALSTDLGYYAVDPEVEANMLAAAEVLRSLGAQVEPVQIDGSPEINEAGWMHWNVYTALIAEDIFEANKHRMDPAVVTAVEAGRQAFATEFKRVELVRTRLWQRMAPIFARYDALLCPTTALPAPPAEADEADYGHVDADGRYHHYEMTFIFNMLSACPALSVPSGFTAAGLPTGLQIAGRRYGDETVLRIGAALEAALGWRSNHPAF